MGDKLIMSKKERQRKSIFDQVLGGDLNQKEASIRLGLSYRQTKRSYRKYVREGDVGLLHKNRGRKPSHSYSEETRALILKHYEERYDGFGPTLASEYLWEEFGLKVCFPRGCVRSQSISDLMRRRERSLPK